MGIPLLYPWANRLARMRFAVAGREVVIDPEATPLRVDANGLPMHGLLTAASGWEVEHHERGGGRRGARGALRLRRPRALLAAFPFAHQLRFDARWRGRR